MRSLDDRESGSRHRLAEPRRVGPQAVAQLGRALDRARSPSGRRPRSAGRRCWRRGRAAPADGGARRSRVGPATYPPQAPPIALPSVPVTMSTRSSPRGARACRDRSARRSRRRGSRRPSRARRAGRRARRSRRARRCGRPSRRRRRSRSSGVRVRPPRRAAPRARPCRRSRSATAPPCRAGCRR